MKVPGNKIFFWLTFSGLIVLVLGILFGFAFFPLIINDQIYRNVRLKQGTDQYERWVNLPITVYYKIQMFNVTNADEVMNDNAIPIVEEVGPYIYKQTRQKRDITYHEENDTLSFFTYVHFEFDVNGSYPRTEDDTVVIVNPVLNVFFNMLSSILPENLHFAADYLWKNVFPDSDTLFHTVRVGDILFDGYRFCDPQYLNGTDDYSLLTCAVFRLMNISLMERESDGSVKFSFFKWKQDAHDGRYNVNAGNKDVNKLGLINSWNGYFYRNNWKGRLSSCNKVRGCDSVTYHPFLKNENDVEIFTTELCRVVNLYYTDEVEILDIPGDKYILREDTYSISTNPQNECFCSDNVRDLYNEQKCLPDGYFDLQPCLGVPIVGSFPHFLFADEAYSNTVIGLSSDIDSHQSYVVLEPRTGTPLAGFKRIQFNVMLKPVQGVNVTQVQNSLLPILWAEEGVTITDELADMLKSQYFNVLQAVEIVKWVIIGIGGVMFLGFGGVYLYLLKFR